MLRFSLLMTVLPFAALAEVPRVVADMPVTASLVAQVMGTLGTPETVLEQGADAHGFQMRPSQAAAVQEAGLLVWVGPEMTAWLAPAVAQRGDKPQLALLAEGGGLVQPYGETGHHDHAHEAAGEEAHDHEGSDPHAWLDPENAKAWLDAIAGRLSALDPDNAATYAANAEAGKARLSALSDELAARLAPHKAKPFIVYHDAYGYLSAHFGLKRAETLADGAAALPGAARLREMAADIKAEGITCLFPEAGHDAALLEAVARDSGLTLAPPLDPEGVLVAPGPLLHETVLRGVAETLAGCFERN